MKTQYSTAPQFGYYHHRHHHHSGHSFFGNVFEGAVDRMIYDQRYGRHIRSSDNIAKEEQDYNIINATKLVFKNQYDVGVNAEDVFRKFLALEKKGWAKEFEEKTKQYQSKKETYDQKPLLVRFLLMVLFQRPRRPKMPKPTAVSLTTLQNMFGKHQKETVKKVLGDFAIARTLTVKNDEILLKQLNIQDLRTL